MPSRTPTIYRRNCTKSQVKSCIHVLCLSVHAMQVRFCALLTENPQIQIVYTSDFDTCNTLCEEIYTEQPLLIGLDCEWKPNRHKREHHKLAVIQICTSNKCLIIQCIQWEQLPRNLVRILTASNIIKTGVGIHGDSKVIRNSFGVSMRGYFDIRYLGVLLYENNLLIPKNCFGLKGLALYLFGVQIPRESATSDWEHIPLSDEQILYGSLDAYHSRMVTLMLLHCYKIKRIIHHRTDDTLGILRQMDRQETVQEILTKYQYLINHPFRQPHWLQGSNVSSSKKSESNNGSAVGGKGNKSDYTLAKLEEKWLGLHVAKYQKKRKGLEYWNMYGPDGKFVAKVKKKRVVWYVQRGLGVVISDKAKNGQLPTFQLVFRLKRYEFPGADAYVMKSCFVCRESADDGKHLFKHSILPKCYRRCLSAELQKLLSHELVPLCGICKERVEAANLVYRKELEEEKYVKYNPVTPERKKAARSAAAILRQSDKLPAQRKNELLQKVADYHGEEDVSNITHEMVVKTSNLLSDQTFAEILMAEFEKRPEELYSFIVGWKQHFVDTLKPKHLKNGWMVDGNQRLREILDIDVDEEGNDS